MNKFKSWLVQRFLPSWAKETVFEENEKLKQTVLKLEIELKAERAFSQGLKTALREIKPYFMTGGENKWRL